MPAFIKTPKDEARWAKAKKAASKTLSESDGDSYWALTNSIYQKMNKSEEMDRLETILLKARRRLSDEPEEDEQDVSPEEAGMREFDPDEEGDDADKWLEENDPKKEDEENEDEYNEYGPDEDEESHQQDVEPDEEQDAEPVAEDETPGTEGSEGGGGEGSPDEGQSPQEAPAQEAPVSEGRFPQPTREDLAEMRQYTRPWEQRAREKTRLEAEPSKNPVLHHEGKMLEAKNAAHKNYQDAYKDMQKSPEYQSADPVTQMEMDSKFESDFHKQNPDYLSNAAKLHSEAHKKGLEAKDVHAAAKDEAIRHVLGGGAQAETPMSTEEALQHAGGAKGEEGTVGSMTQDPSSSFASGNRAFLEQYAKDYGKKAKKPKDVNEMMNYDEGSKADVQRVLGEHPALKDPAKKAKVDAFFAKYHPLIGMNASKVLNKFGLDAKRGDIDLGMLHEAGMHGLMQSINDYNHDHPSKASFATHAGNKIRGLQQTAMRSQDQIPQELRTGAKKFQQAQAAPVSRPDIKSLIGKHPPEVADRMKRIDTFKQAQAPKVPKPEGERMGNDNEDEFTGGQTPDGLYEDLLAGDFGTGNIMGAGIVRTPTIQPFPAWATKQEPGFDRYLPLPDPETMKNGPLFGLPLRSFLTGQVVQDKTIESYVAQAISEIEHTLNLFITPVTFSERHDYSREMQFYAFGIIKLYNSPILNVEEYELTFNNGIGIPGSLPLVKIPLEFIHVQPQDGTIQLVPAQGVTISGFIVSIYSGLGYHAFNSQAISYWPGAVFVRYRAGFERHRVPALLVALIENLAAYKFLSALGPVLFPYNSTSLGIDGTSQSVSTPGPLFLQNRLKDLQQMIQTEMEAAKGYYQSAS